MKNNVLMSNAQNAGNGNGKEYLKEGCPLLAFVTAQSRYSESMIIDNIDYIVENMTLYHKDYIHKRLNGEVCRVIFTEDCSKDGFALECIYLTGTPWQVLHEIFLRFPEVKTKWSEVRRILEAADEFETIAIVFPREVKEELDERQKALHSMLIKWLGRIIETTFALKEGTVTCL